MRDHLRSKNVNHTDSTHTPQFQSLQHRRYIVIMGSQSPLQELHSAHQPRLRQYTHSPLSQEESMLNPLETVSSQPDNPFAALIPHQRIAIVTSFTLESGVTLYNVPVAYSFKGNLNDQGNNVLVICHALSGSADVGDWWGPLIGLTGKAFDLSRFYVICLNSLGSPYGSASPVTNVDGDPEKGRYGPDFPLTTIRDDVKYKRPCKIRCAS